MLLDPLIRTPFRALRSRSLFRLHTFPLSPLLSSLHIETVLILLYTVVCNEFYVMKISIRDVCDGSDGGEGEGSAVMAISNGDCETEIECLDDRPVPYANRVSI